MWYAHRGRRKATGQTGQRSRELNPVMMARVAHGQGADSCGHSSGLYCCRYWRRRRAPRRRSRSMPRRAACPRTSYRRTTRWCSCRTSRRTRCAAPRRSCLRVRSATATLMFNSLHQALDHVLFDGRPVAAVNVRRQGAADQRHSGPCRGARPAPPDLFLRRQDRVAPVRALHAELHAPGRRERCAAVDQVRGHRRPAHVSVLGRARVPRHLPRSASRFRRPGP